MMNMKFCAVMLCFSSMFSLSSGMRETCTNARFQYRAGSTFQSIKQDGRRYVCTCRGLSCDEINCTQLSGPTPTMMQPPTSPTTVSVDDEISGEVPSSSAAPNPRRPHSGRPIYLQPIFVPSYGSQGNEIQGCYDPWQNREYESGSTYNRTRFMDVHNLMSGKYECNCINSRIHCKAVDIPCCNLETGEFVGLHQSFITSLGGMVMECTCNREGGKFSNCRRVVTAPELNPLPLASGYRPRYGCRDTTTRRFYAVGSTWVRTTSQATMRCQCRRAGPRRVRTTCRWVGGG